MKITTHYVYPPIPLRQFDWMAIDDDTYDGAEDSRTRSQIGYGRTEAEAVADLCEQLEICPTCYADKCCYECATQGGNGASLLDGERP